MENMKCDKVKFVQIAASKIGLFGLDQHGQVWFLHSDERSWNKLTMPSEYEKAANEAN